jgi:hypothetical protein
MLCLQHDFYTIIFENSNINYKSLQSRPPPPPPEKIQDAHLLSVAVSVEVVHGLTNYGQAWLTICSHHPPVYILQCDVNRWMIGGGAYCLATPAQKS